MSMKDLLTTAFLNLWRRKLRTFLTVLGMVIGVASIVVMVSLGIGIKQATVESFAGTGSLTTIRVNSWSYVSSGNGGGGSRHLPEAHMRQGSFTPAVKGAVGASEEEAERNPRARSAKLRAGIRTEYPPLKADYSIFGLPTLPVLPETDNAKRKSS